MLEVFNNNQFLVRVAKDENNEPLFCLNDVCKSLGLVDTRQSRKSIEREFEGMVFKTTPFKTEGGVQNFTMISEPQLYFLIMRSDKPNAKAFRMWVNCEVLPTIRKQGYYKLQKETDNKISNLERRNKRVALGYKSQLAQQKEKYELQIKSLKCELEHGQKIDFKKGIDKDLKRQLAERGYLLMNLADFHSLGEGLAARMFEGLGQIFGKHYPPCLKQLPILHFYGATDYYNVKIHNNLGNTPQRAWGVNVGVLNAKLKPVDKIYSPIYNKWVIEDGEQIAGWELGCELKWKGNTKIQHGS